MLHIPPVLANATLVGVEEHSHHTALVFVPSVPFAGDGYVRVEIVAKGKLRYVYAYHDGELNTTVHYSGPYGDPERDERIEITAGPE